MSADRLNDPHAGLRARRRDAADSYPTRILCGLIASLTVTLAVVHLPLETAPEAVGWHLKGHADRDVIALRDVRTLAGRNDGVPITRFEEQVFEAFDGKTATEEEEPAEVISPAEQPQRMPGLEMAAAAPQMPEIVGGLGAFYVHIDYPEEAVRLEIEGRLMLSFIVRQDGTTEDVRVIQSLHPACDSAAVAALERTRFVPGRSEGEPIAMRMRLPVRFRLVSQ